jgi:hypothetical protein
MNNYKRSIVITYRDGTTISIDVPDLYYKNKYNKKSDAKLHSIFLKEYNSFINAVNTQCDIIKVGKYLKFSNATISAKNILGIDIVESACCDNNSVSSAEVNIPGVHDKVYLSIEDSKIKELIDKLCDTELIGNIDSLVKKLNSFLGNSNVEFTLKKRTKSSTSNKKQQKQDTDSPKDGSNSRQILLESS